MHASNYFCHWYVNFKSRIFFLTLKSSPFFTPQESIQESFIPDKNSSSFKRPTKDMNIAAGCPMFIRKEKLQQFIVDDVLFIETSITNVDVLWRFWRFCNFGILEIQFNHTSLI